MNFLCWLLDEHKYRNKRCVRYGCDAFVGGYSPQAGTSLPHKRDWPPIYKPPPPAPTPPTPPARTRGMIPWWHGNYGGRS